MEETRNYPCFRFDAKLLQLLVCEDQILTFRAINAIAYFAGIVIMFVGFIYGTYLWISMNATATTLFNSNVDFRTTIVLFWAVFPFFGTWIFIRFERKRSDSKLKTIEGLEKFLAGRAGNVKINWEEVETASLEGSKLVLNLKNGGFRAGWLKQVYCSQEEPRLLSSPQEDLELLKEFLRQKLGSGFEVNDS